MQGVLLHNDNSKTTFVTVNQFKRIVSTKKNSNSKTTFVTVNLSQKKV